MYGQFLKMSKVISFVQTCLENDIKLIPPAEEIFRFHGNTLNSVLKYFCDK